MDVRVYVMYAVFVSGCASARMRVYAYGRVTMWCVCVRAWWCTCEVASVFVR